MAAVTLVVGLALAGCSRGSSTVSVTRMNSDSAVVDTNLTAYQNLNNQSLTSVDQLRTFATPSKPTWLRCGPRSTSGVTISTTSTSPKRQRSVAPRTRRCSRTATRSTSGLPSNSRNHRRRGVPQQRIGRRCIAVLPTTHRPVLLDPDRQQFERRPQSTAISTRPMTTPEPTRASTSMGRSLRS